jgi:hypothetical protein
MYDSGGSDHVLLAGSQPHSESEDVSMTHAMHDAVVDVVKKAIRLMDRVLRRQLNAEEYKAAINELDVDSIMATYREEFKSNPSLIYYLDALMLVASLQRELDFEVAEYGLNVALDDKKNLEDLLRRFPNPSDS